MPHKRIPIEERIVYHSLKLGESPVITLNVDGDEWKVIVTLVHFKTDRKGVTYHLGNNVLHPPFQNMVNRLQHHFPHLTKLTEKKLVALIKDSVKKGIFEQGRKDEAKIFLTLDSWMQLKPKTDKSQLITTTATKYRRLTIDEPYKL